MQALLAQSEYDAANNLFQHPADHEQAASLVISPHYYSQDDSQFDDGKYDMVRAQFSVPENCEDAISRISQAYYLEGQELLKNNHFEKANRIGLSFRLLIEETSATFRKAGYFEDTPDVRRLVYCEGITRR